MAQRGMLAGHAKITPAMFAEALSLRSALRSYLQFDPDARRKNKDVVRSLDVALESFPLTVKTASGHGSTLAAVRGDALSGLSAIVAELYDGSRNGTLDRLKMCASEECRRVFFDRSKPATRRWCMSTLCGNRIKTRAYRERHRGHG
jgi:predicted RNA-binding Zn ribbon-like protein